MAKLVEVTVAAGWQPHDPSGDVIEIALGEPLDLGGGETLDLPIAQHLPPQVRGAAPGAVMLVDADAVPRLLAMGVIEEQHPIKAVSQLCT